MTYLLCSVQIITWCHLLFGAPLIFPIFFSSLDSAPITVWDCVEEIKTWHTSLCVSRTHTHSGAEWQTSSQVKRKSGRHIIRMRPYSTGISSKEAFVSVWIKYGHLIFFQLKYVDGIYMAICRRNEYKSAQGILYLCYFCTFQAIIIWALNL